RDLCRIGDRFGCHRDRRQCRIGRHCGCRRDRRADRLGFVVATTVAAAAGANAYPGDAALPLSGTERRAPVHVVASPGMAAKRDRDRPSHAMLVGAGLRVDSARNQNGLEGVDSTDVERRNAMTKLLAGVASVGLLAALSLLSPAAATERLDGIRTHQAGTVDLSAHRRYYRRRVIVVRRYVRPYYYGGYYPYSYYGG